LILDPVHLLSACVYKSAGLLKSWSAVPGTAGPDNQSVFCRLFCKIRYRATRYLELIHEAFAILLGGGVVGGMCKETVGSFRPYTEHSFKGNKSQWRSSLWVLFQ